MDKKKLKQVAPYEVGYGKPPEETQFTKGQSGNPKGRPKGAKNKNPLDKSWQFSKLFIESMQEPVVDNDNPNMPAKPSALKQLEILKGLAHQGNIKALNILTKTSYQIEKDERERSERIVEKMHDYKVITTAVIRERKNKGIPIDDILPHPDHVQIDLKTVEVHLSGPSNKKEKELWDIIHAAIKQLLEQITANTKLLLNSENKNESKKIWEKILIDIDHMNRARDYFSTWDIVFPWQEIEKCLASIRLKYPNFFKK